MEQDKRQWLHWVFWRVNRRVAPRLSNIYSNDDEKNEGCVNETVVPLNELNSILYAFVLSELTHLSKIEMTLYFNATDCTVIHNNIISIEISKSPWFISIQDLSMKSILYLQFMFESIIHKSKYATKVRIITLWSEIENKYISNRIN